MTNFNGVPSKLFPEVRLIERTPLEDDRGSFQRIFCRRNLPDWKPRDICQINWSKTSSAGSVRGMHYQVNPNAECKYVTCIKGKVCDVFVDLRQGSPTYGLWDSVELSERVSVSLLIPEGFAHGFQTLEDDTELLYLHSASYDPSLYRGVNPLCTYLGIHWPKPVINLSAKDKFLPSLPEINGIKL